MNRWKLLAGCLFLLLGLAIVIRNELFVHGVLGVTVTGAILIVLGILTIALKKEECITLFSLQIF